MRGTLQRFYATAPSPDNHFALDLPYPAVHLCRRFAVEFVRVTPYRRSNGEATTSDLSRVIDTDRSNYLLIDRSVCTVDLLNVWYSSWQPIAYTNIPWPLQDFSRLHKTTNANITKLQRAQHSLAHVVLQNPKRTHADDLLAQLHWLPVSYLIEYKIGLIACKALKFGQPSYLADLLIHLAASATRSKGLCRLHQSVPNSQTSSRGFRYAAPSIWN